MATRNNIYKKLEEVNYRVKLEEDKSFAKTCFSIGNNVN